MNLGACHLEPAIAHDLVLQLLQRTFGPKVELTGYQIGKQLHDYLVLVVQLCHPVMDIVIKLAGPEASMPCPFERTAMLHRLVASRTTIPMPEVLAVDVSYHTWPWRYLIREYTPGLEWAVVRQQMNREELSNACRQIGNAVAQLHAIHFPMFGELGADGSVEGDGTCLSALTGRVRYFIKNEHLSDLFYSVLERQRHLFLDVGQASLCHDDLHKYNILFQHRQGQWHLATILDFDKAWAGHHETDLARLELWKDMMGHEFWSSYEEICSPEPLYTQRRPIYQLLWCLEYAQPTREHLADTRRLCKELGLPRIERFE